MGLAAREQGFDRVLQGFAESDSGSQSGAKGDGDIAIAFEGEKFPTQLAEWGIASAAHDGVGSLNEEVADVAAFFAMPEISMVPITRPSYCFSTSRNARKNTEVTFPPGHLLQKNAHSCRDA
jgi:hypothetical protein